MMAHLELGQENEALRYCKLYLDRMEALNQYVPYQMPQVIYILMHSGSTEEASFYLKRMIEYDQDALNSNPLDLLMRSLFINALMNKTENIYNDLSSIARQERLNIWVTKLRNSPEFKEISGEPEFLRLVVEIEKKYQAQRERDRKWLVENEML